MIGVYVQDARIVAIYRITCVTFVITLFAYVHMKLMYEILSIKVNLCSVAILAIGMPVILSICLPTF